MRDAGPMSSCKNQCHVTTGPPDNSRTSTGQRRPTGVIPGNQAGPERLPINSPVDKARPITHPISLSSV